MMALPREVAILILTLYTGALVFILAYSCAQAHLVWLYWRARRRPTPAPPPLPTDRTAWPSVTVQLPIYNERYVVERLLAAVAAFDYPRDRFEVQVLDDSTDDTVGLVADLVARYAAEGLRVAHVRRPDRVGFKAGALAYGLERAEGELVAIFDADFLPPPDFLRRTVPHFTDPQTGVVQTRWGHLNGAFSWLTRLQAFGLNAHFTVEQGGRYAGRYFLNFNGTAGLWRKSCIEAAGGWQSDTLTEDLDLSYRAQLLGWRFRYLEAVETPAELPVALSALKNQQYRWTKGAAECARKNLPAVLRATQLPLATRLHATFHLLNSTIFVCVILSALLSLPMLLVKAQFPEFAGFFRYASLFLVSTVVLSAFYWTAFRRSSGPEPPTLRAFARAFPLFLSVSMGLSLHNAVAVVEGYLGRRTPFIRTPKFNVLAAGDAWHANRYWARGLGAGTWAEGLLALYFAGGVALGIYLGDYGLLPFHLLLTLGFGVVFGYAVWQSRTALRRRVPTDGATVAA